MNNPFDPAHIQEEKAEREARRLKLRTNLLIALFCAVLGGFFAASVSIGIAFIVTFAVMKGAIGAEAWKPLGALCGSWMGGSGNMIAVQAALDIGETEMAYALVVVSIDYSIRVMFLLRAINPAPLFRWVS